MKLRPFCVFRTDQGRQPGEENSIAELEGYMDFERYGSDCMEHDGVVETEFGRLRRLEPPFPEQVQEQQMLQQLSWEA